MTVIPQLRLFKRNTLTYNGNRIMSFTDQLINVLYKITTGSKKVRTLLTPVGATVFFCFIILFIVSSLYLDRVLKLPKLLPSPLNLVLSLPLLFFGLFLVLWSVLHFLKVNGTPVPFNPPPRLVTNGPYVHVRNLFCEAGETV